MRHRHPRRRVGLHQRERRARDLLVGVAGERPDERAGERRLAGAELARKREQVAAARDESEMLGQAGKRGLADAVNDVRGGDCGHALFTLSGAATRPIAALRAFLGQRLGAALSGRPRSGRRTVTRVPWPGSESSDMSPPCSSTRLLTIERPRPAPRCLEPWLRLSKRSKTLRCWSLGMPTPWSSTVNTIMPASRRQVMPMVSPGLEKPTAFDSRL